MALPVGQNYTGWVGLSNYANLVTNGLFWELMLAAVCIVIFFVIYKQSGENASAAFFAVSWAFFFLNIFLSIIGLVPATFVGIGLGLLGFSTFLLALSKERF